MSSTIKKLNLVRETVRSMRTRTGMRAGMMKETQVPDLSDVDSAGSAKSSSAPASSNPTGNNTGTMSIAMDKSLPASALQSN